jgi:tol-pal system protein YbgF
MGREFSESLRPKGSYLTYVDGFFMYSRLIFVYSQTGQLVSRHQIQGTTFILFAVIVLSVALSSCRPSQQTRRGDASRSGQTASAGKMMDSLLMVQNRLVTVIDTMSDVIVSQHDRIRTLEAEVARLRSLIESRGLTGSSSMGGGYYTQPTPTVSAPPNSAPMPPATESYSAALRLFNDGRYEEALAAFDALAYNEPNSPYAPNFLYWRGESLYALGSYNEAVTSFQGVLDRYPNSSKADDAQFKIGSSQEKLKNTFQARAAYEQLVQGYPESEYVGRARARLSRLR